LLVLKSKCQVYLVKGIVMCQDAGVAASIEEARERRKKLGAPLGTVIEAVAASQGVPVSTGGVGNISGGAPSEATKTLFAAEGSERKILPCN